MAKKEKKTFVFEQLEAPVARQVDNTTNALPTNISPNYGTQPLGNSTKITFDCTNDLVDMMKDYGYWEGLSQKEIIIESLLAFFEDKDIKERPEKVKNRKKVGRKPKNVSTNPYI